MGSREDRPRLTAVLAAFVAAAKEEGAAICAAIVAALEGSVTTDDAGHVAYDLGELASAAGAELKRDVKDLVRAVNDEVAYRGEEWEKLGLADALRAHLIVPLSAKAEVTEPSAPAAKAKAKGRR